VVCRFCLRFLAPIRHVSTIGKKLVKQQYLLHISLQYGELRPTSGWDLFVSLGHRGNFNGFRVLAALLHGTVVVGVSQTLRRWTEGATYIRQGGHHVGHWPTFLVCTRTSLGMSGNISHPVIHVIVCGLLAQWVCVVLAVSMCCFSRRWFTPVSMQLAGLSSFAAFQCVRLRRSCSVGTCTRRPFWWSSFQWRNTGLILRAEIWYICVHFHSRSWNMILLHQTDRHTFNRLFFQGTLGKPVPERLNQSGF